MPITKQELTDILHDVAVGHMDTEEAFVIAEHLIATTDKTLDKLCQVVIQMEQRMQNIEQLLTPEPSTIIPPVDADIIVRMETTGEDWETAKANLEDGL